MTTPPNRRIFPPDEAKHRLAEIKADIASRRGRQPKRPAYRSYPRATVARSTKWPTKKPNQKPVVLEQPPRIRTYAASPAEIPAA